MDGWIAAQIGAPVSPESLARFQTEKLRDAVAFAKENSDFYRERLAGVSPDDIRTPADLVALPFTTPEDIVREGERFLCVSRGEFERIVTLQTSGTTQAAKRLFFTQANLERTTDFFAVGMSGIVSPGDRTLILLPGERPDSVGDLLRRALERIGAVGIPHGPVRDPAETRAIIRRQNVDSLIGIPVQQLSLLRSDGGEPLPPGQIRNTVLCTDHVPRAIKTALESAWGCRAFGHYGSTEMGLSAGVECAARDGYHLREADLFFEIVDPATGHTVPDGETGEIVFTTLDRFGMPLIRYRTGDVSRFLPEPCPCGSRLPRMAPVRERLGKRIELGGNLGIHTADLDEALFPQPGLLDFAAEVAGPPESRTLRLTLRPGRGAVPSTLAAEAEQAVSRIPAVRAALNGGTLRIGPPEIQEGNPAGTASSEPGAENTGDAIDLFSDPPAASKTESGPFALSMGTTKRGVVDWGRGKQRPPR
jgi:phenylacetate-coenzyme A ligase PaaK-like adenylate-forming protein